MATLLVKVNIHCISVEAYQTNDFQFFTRFGYQIDTRIFRRLQQCEMQQNREKVDDNIVDFHPLVSLSLNNQFIRLFTDTFKSNDNNDGNNVDLSSHYPKKRKNENNNQEKSCLNMNTGHYQIGLCPKKYTENSSQENTWMTKAASMTDQCASIFTQRGTVSLTI